MSDCDYCGAPAGYPPAGPCPEHPVLPQQGEPDEAVQLREAAIELLDAVWGVRHYNGPGGAGRIAFPSHKREAWGRLARCAATVRALVAARGAGPVNPAQEPREDVLLDIIDRLLGSDGPVTRDMPCRLCGATQPAHYCGPNSKAHYEARALLDPRLVGREQEPPNLGRAFDDLAAATDDLLANPPDIARDDREWEDDQIEEPMDYTPIGAKLRAELARVEAERTKAENDWSAYATTLNQRIERLTKRDTLTEAEIDKAAEAIWEKEGWDDKYAERGSWSSLNEEQKAPWVKIARAALLAARE